MNSRSFGFIGGGRVTRIILEGLQHRGQELGDVAVSDVDDAALKRLKDRFPGLRLSLGDNRTPAACDTVFLALHPPACSTVLAEIKGSLMPGAMFISLAPKITMAQLSDQLGGFSRIVRMIPNAPSIVGAGFNPIAYSPAIDDREKKDLLRLFLGLGDCPEVPEKDLEAYAILSAMGPTYFWFQWEELERLGSEFGLSREDVRKALAAMVGGASKAYFGSGLTPAEVMDLVPVKPLKDDEEEIKLKYRGKLKTLYDKIRC